MDPVVINFIINLTDVQAVCAGDNHSMALTRDGKVFAWGANGHGRLGDGTREDRLTPVAVQGLEGVISISAGWNHSMALTRDGKVFAWGYNGFGQLGDGTRGLDENRSTPVAVQGLEDVISISAGDDHSMALTRDGKVFAWGCNVDGQLGDGTREDRLTPVAVQDLEDVISISAGGFHSMALTRDGKVFAWGYNRYGELGDGTRRIRSTPVAALGLEDVISISAGVSHSMALTSDGKVFAWGYNRYRQLGDGTSANRSTPVAVQDLENMVSISAGENNSMALQSDGDVFAWGFIHGEYSDEESYSEQESDGEREEVCKYYKIPNTPEEKKWRIGHCRGDIQCLISLDDQLKNSKAMYIISPSGRNFAYKTTEILKWLKNKNTNPGSSEVIPNSRELANSLEGIVQYQEDSG